MENQQKILTIFTDKGQSVFSGMMRKYDLDQNQEELFAALEKGQPFKEEMLKEMIRMLAKEVISEKDFTDALQKALRINLETAKQITTDVVTNLLPLIDKVPENKLEEYNKKKDQELEDQKNTFADELLRKIRAGKGGQPEAANQPAPVNRVKKIPIGNVEENAEQLQKTRQPIASGGKETVMRATTPTPPRPPAAPAPEKSAQDIAADPYKEKVE